MVYYETLEVKGKVLNHKSYGFNTKPQQEKEKDIGAEL